MRSIKSKRESTQGNEIRCTTFRISHFIQTASKQIPTPRGPLLERRNNLADLTSRRTLKLSIKKLPPSSSRNFRKPEATILTLNKLVKYHSSQQAELISREIEIGERNQQTHQTGGATELLKQIYSLSEHMYEEVYSYLQIEACIRQLHVPVKQLGSSTFVYRSFAFAGFVLYEYGSYSLSLYYFDRALKTFYDRQTQVYYEFERQLELQLYKFVCRIFLAKARYAQAKTFAFKLLRKAWLINNLDEEMAAYDLLGKVYMQLQNISMCRYFHARMKSGEKESPQITAMSRQEMEKESRQKMEFVCYETINIFVDKDSPFNDILENHYRVRSLEFAAEEGLQEIDNKTIYVYTHHSPNRQLSNYHLLERKLIEAKQSKELHFIRPKDSHRLKNLFSNYSAIVHEIMQRVSYSHFPTEFTIKEPIP